MERLGVTDLVAPANEQEIDGRKEDGVTSSGVQSFDVGKSVEAEVTAIGDLYLKMTKQQCHRLLQCRQPPRPPSPQPPRESHDVSLPSSSMEANNGVGLWLLSGEAAVADRTMRNMDKD
nr:hypothetical protein Iba_chr05eCG8310 [Ipomoea batatas]